MSAKLPELIDDLLLAHNLVERRVGEALRRAVAAPPDDPALADVVRCTACLKSCACGLAGKPGGAAPLSAIPVVPADPLQHSFRTNDRVVLKLDGSVFGARTLFVNGLAVPLTLRQHFVLKELLNHALTAEGEFIRLVALRDQVEDAVAGYPGNGQNSTQPFWPDVTEDSLHHEIHGLRQRLIKAGANPHLIESSACYAGGVRISTPAANIQIILPPTHAQPESR